MVPEQNDLKTNHDTPQTFRHPKYSSLSVALSKSLSLTHSHELLCQLPCTQEVLNTQWVLFTGSDKDNRKRKIHLKLQVPFWLCQHPSWFSQEKRITTDLKWHQVVFCLCVKDPLHSATSCGNSSSLVKFWTIYAILHLRAQKRQPSSWCMDVTECFYSTPEKKLPVFDTLENVEPESAWGEDATPALHLSAFICLQTCL